MDYLLQEISTSGNDITLIRVDQKILLDYLQEISDSRNISGFSVLGSETYVGLSTFTGDYNNLRNKPTIPTNNNELTNGAGYITGISGIDTTGTSFFNQLNVSGISTFQDNVHLLDNDKLLLGGSVGTHDGLEIYHDSNNSYITDSGSGNLLIGSDNDLWITNAAGTENIQESGLPRMVVSIFILITLRNLKPLLLVLM